MSALAYVAPQAMDAQLAYIQNNTQVIAVLNQLVTVTDSAATIASAVIASIVVGASTTTTFSAADFTIGAGTPTNSRKLTTPSAKTIPAVASAPSNGAGMNATQIVFLNGALGTGTAVYVEPVTPQLVTASNPVTVPSVSLTITNL